MTYTISKVVPQCRSLTNSVYGSSFVFHCRVGFGITEKVGFGVRATGRVGVCYSARAVGARFSQVPLKLETRVAQIEDEAARIREQLPERYL